MSANFDTIIFDIGDVLFSWSPNTKTSISPKTLRAILSSPTWFDYEKGQLTESACYERVGSEFFIEPDEVRRAFDQARDSLRSNEDLIILIRELKELNPTLKVFAMSNISIPDYEVLRTKPADWSLFDRIFTSGAAGERKPNLGFYRHVLAETGSDPYRTVFVDDKQENVLSARSFGLQGIVCDDHDKVKRALRNLLGDPLVRGRQFLQNNAGKLYSVTDNDIELRENFAQLLILEATEDRSLVNIVDHPHTWNFFHGKGLLTTEAFPADLDTTSLGLTIMRRDTQTVHSIMDEMLEYVNSDGIVQTYFDHRRPRVDPVVCVNILSLFYSYDRGHELEKTLRWVYEVLLHRAYTEGSRYYVGGDCFLFFIMRLLQRTNDIDLHSLLMPMLKERIQEQIGKAGDALALAMRILVCHFVGLRDDVDLRSLLPLQCEDGGWEIGWLYGYGSSRVKIGNRGLTTALAVKAIQSLCHPPSPTLTLIEPEQIKVESDASDENTTKRPHKIIRLKSSLRRLFHPTKLRKAVEVF